MWLRPRMKINVNMTFGVFPFFGNSLLAETGDNVKTTRISCVFGYRKEMKRLTALKMVTIEF